MATAAWLALRLTHLISLFAVACEIGQTWPRSLERIVVITAAFPE